MLYTNDRGEQFEEVPHQGFEDGRLTIRPVPLKPKWDIKTFGKPPSQNGLIEIYWHDSDQSQLIKEWVSTGMAYLMGECEQSTFVIATGKARTAFRGAK